MTKCYVDIETSGFSPQKNDITIIGLLCDGQFEQFVENINLRAYYVDEFIMQHEPTELIGFNNINFDIPFMKEFGIETLSNMKHTDLMHQCHVLNLMGGLKKVEQILGIERKYEPLNFFQQKALWAKWINNNDHTALDRLLKYNKEDVINLPLVEEKLDEKVKKQKEKNNIFRKAYLKSLKIDK